MRLPRRLVGSVVLRWRARGAGPRERAPQGQVKVHVGPTVDNSSGQRGPWLARPTRRAVGLKLTWDWASVCLRGGGGLAVPGGRTLPRGCAGGWARSGPSKSPSQGCSDKTWEPAAPRPGEVTTFMRKSLCRP